MISRGTGRPTSQPATRTGLRPWRSASEAESDDIGEGGRHRGQPEHLGGKQRQKAPFLADHAADQGVDPDQEAELGQVGPQSQPRSLGADR
jgi:hypothetical protein